MRIVADGVVLSEGRSVFAVHCVEPHENYYFSIVTELPSTGHSEVEVHCGLLVESMYWFVDKGASDYFTRLAVT